ncbi:unnamed protein product [Spirodela intermedia]|uniref:Uncharacterized protein n=1 Tax=Spirodela intermedia TaxID=51605 RepID=A0A7I8IEI1_SPIIN|nr:unnamed protein product [Spirodela intermedia]CAA6656210.1 unnamed protein product [Spirodela intermedia]
MLASVLETCSQLGSVDQGIRLRRLIPPALRKNFSLSSKLGHRARSAFPWNSLISGYADLGLYEDAVALYHQMEEDGVEPDQFTFPRVLKACAGLRSNELGEAAHRHAVRAGFGSDPFVLNALVDMYAKCGDIDKACRIFAKITHRDAARALLRGVGGLQGMLSAGTMPDPVAVAVSTILAGAPSLRLGAEIHGWVLRRGLVDDLSVGNALIGMYGGQNLPGGARSVFASMPEKDVVSWNAMIRAHRRDERALTIFRQMEDAGVEPDRVTFVSLLAACANTGLVEEGRELFAAMEERHRMKPGIEHYGCIVNLLGRAGLVEEAYETVKKMEFDGGPTVWGALLYACSLHRNVAIAEAAAAALFELEPDNAHNFELLVKVYGDAGRWEDAERVRRMIRERGLDS